MESVPHGVTRDTCFGSAVCSECSAPWSEHGWVGGEPLCVGSWMVRDGGRVTVMGYAELRESYEHVTASVDAL